MNIDIIFLSKSYNICFKYIFVSFTIFEDIYNIYLIYFYLLVDFKHMFIYNIYLQCFQNKINILSIYNRISINRFPIIWNFDHRSFRLFWLFGIFCLLKIQIYLKIKLLKIIIGNFFSEYYVENDFQ